MKKNKINEIERARLDHPGQVVANVNNFSVVDCQNCGFKHAIPLPSTEKLKELYSHEYYSNEKPLYIERYLEDKEWWDAVYEERYIFLEENLNHNSRTILDIGSGPGLFLDKGQKRGWKVKGIEPSIQASSYSRDVLNLDISEEFLDSTTASKFGKFDVINLGEVLEHIPDPFEFLGLIHSMLNDGGIVCIIVPNDFNPIQLFLKDELGFDQWWIDPPHHLNYFDFDSLERLVFNFGFEVIHKEPTFPIDLFLMMGENYIGNDLVGRDCHRKRKIFDLNISKDNDLHKKLKKVFLDMKIGREVVLYAKKV